MSGSRRLAVVLINWNNEEDTIPCLDSLQKQTLNDFVTIVVDNGSDSESYNRLREAHNWPEYVRNDRNKGFTGGNNAGIRRALDFDPEYVLLLNNDTVVEEEFLEDLINAADALPEKTGVVGPKIHTYEDERLWAAGGAIQTFTGSTENRTGDESKYEEPEQVDYAIGASMLVKSDVFRDVGLLDDDFFIYYEETEFCTRARQSGWQVWYVPVSGVYHKESVEYSASPFREYYFTRNRLYFQRKTRSVGIYWLFLGYYLVRWIVFQSLYHIARGDFDSARETVRGGFDAVRGVTGRNH